MNHPLRAAFTMLAFAAMLWAQVFGLCRGFVCDCGGVAEVTMADHCHGPHSEACHEHEEEIPCRGAGDEHHDETDTHEHEALVEALVAGEVANMLLAAPEPEWFVFESHAWLSCEAVAAVKAAERPEARRTDQWRSRSWPQVLAHTVALRI